MIEASAYYEAHQKNLGRRFLVSAQDALNRIVTNPRIFTTVESIHDVENPSCIFDVSVNGKARFSVDLSTISRSSG